MRRADGQWRWQIEFTDTPPMTPTHPGTVDVPAVDGSATGGAAVDGSRVDLLQTLNHPKLDQCKPATTAARQYDTAFGADQSGHAQSWEGAQSGWSAQHVGSEGRARSVRAELFDAS
jgi:hypothetical protein